MKICMREGRISGFRECGSGPHIWPPGAPLLGVGKFWELHLGYCWKGFLSDHSLNMI
jgi:hypothetical protein